MKKYKTLHKQLKYKQLFYFLFAPSTIFAIHIQVMITRQRGERAIRL